MARDLAQIVQLHQMHFQIQQCCYFESGGSHDDSDYGYIYLQLHRCADRKNQSEHSIRSAAIVGWSLMAGRIIVFLPAPALKKLSPSSNELQPPAEGRAVGWQDRAIIRNLHGGETMLASFLTLARFRPLSAVLFGASAGGDAPHRTPPHRCILPPAFRCISEHSTVQERRLPADLRLTP